MAVVYKYRSRTLVWALLIVCSFALGACKGKNSKPRIDRSYTDPNQRATNLGGTQPHGTPGTVVPAGGTPDTVTPGENTTADINLADLPQEPLLNLFATTGLKKVREKFPDPASDYKALRISRVGDLADENLKLVLRIGKKIEVDDCNTHKLPLKFETKTNTDGKEYSYVSLDGEVISTTTTCSSSSKSEKRVEGENKLEISKLDPTNPYGYIIYLPKDLQLEIDAYTSSQDYDLSESISEINFELHETSPEGYNALDGDQKLGILNLNDEGSNTDILRVLIGQWRDSGSCPAEALNVTIESDEDETKEGERRITYLIERSGAETSDDCTEKLTKRKFEEKKSIDINDFNDVEYDFVFADDLDLRLEVSNIKTTIKEP